MKKILFAAIAVCGFAIANAQGGPVQANSSTPAGLAPEVKADADIQLTLYNAIELQPKWALKYSTTFQTAADYNGAAKDMGTRDWDIKSTRPGNITISISDLKDNVGGQTISKDKMNFDLAGSAGTPSVATGTGSQIGTVGFVAGVTNDVVKLNLKVHPGWAHQGGVYNGVVYVTAAQQ